MTPPSPSVSVVICCYNSAARLPRTLEHLRAQDCPGLPWELVIVDNRSSDNTAEVARREWGEDTKAPAPMKIVREEKQGLSFARLAGLHAASGEVIALVDDDNWLPPSWLGAVYRLFSDHPDVTIAGGPIEAACEVEPPTWFQHYCGNFVIVDLAENSQYMQGPLPGAGLCLRRKAWLDLLASGFQPLLTDRRGNSLSSGGDAELCYALMIQGHRVYYEKELRISHFIEAHRLQWSYLLKLQRAFGQQSVILDAYNRIYQGTPFHFSLPRELAATLFRIIRLRIKWLLTGSWRKPENVLQVLIVNQLGRLDYLLREGRTFARGFRKNLSKIQRS